MAATRGLILLLLFVISGLTISTTHETIPSPAPNHSSPLDCDFEGSLCNWKSPKQSINKWCITQGISSASSYSAYSPLSDHTLDNEFGHYASVGGGMNGAVMMSSPRVVVPESGICFQFWYYMFGTSVSSLTLYMTTAKTSWNGKTYRVWKMSGSQGVDWKRARVHIQGVTGEAYLTVQTTNDDYTWSTPVLDDFSMTYGHCPPSDVCDFEDDSLCSYTQLTSDDFDWSVSKPGTRTNLGIPKNDHTFETAAGHFLFIDASSNPQNVGKKALLESILFHATTHSCLSFWYNMEGKSMGTLNVKSKSSSNESNEVNDQKLLWTKSRDEGGVWLLANVDLSSSAEYVIIFEGILGHGTHSSMAIDDIRVKDGHCPEPNNCDFEEHTCMWENIAGDSADWERATANFVGRHSPKFDHTLYTHFGHYLYFDARHLSHGDLAKVSSPTFDKGNIYCLHFWYHLEGLANLTIITQDLGTKIEKNIPLNITHTDTKSWSLVRQVLGPFVNDFKVVFIGTVSGYMEDFCSIAVDDITIQKGSCEETSLPGQTRNALKCSNGTYLSQKEICDFKNDCPDGEDEKRCGYNCDFENGTSCGWVASGESPEWAVQTGATSLQEGGPKLDNTLNAVDGHYLNLKTGRAVLYSPVFQKSAPSCEMVFSLFLQTTIQNDLSIQKIVREEKVILFKADKFSDDEAKWQPIIVPLGQSEVPFKVKFQGRKKNDLKASIAVDDIYFRNCDFPQPHVSCTSTNTFQCTNGGCVHPALMCNYLDDCGDGSDEDTKICLQYNRCSFESGMCEWSQAKDEDDFDWTLTDSSHSSDPPTIDHTTSMESGNYMMIKSTFYHRLPGDKAWLLSPVFKSTSNCSLTLYVFMNKEAIERFSIYTRSEIGGKLTQVFTKTEVAALVWTTVHIQLKSSTDFQVIVEGRFGELRNDEEKLAIDDLILSPGCVPSPRSLPASSNVNPLTTPSPCDDVRKWHCADGSGCIYRFELCDFVTQCTDGSDEQDCGACDFETSLCGWRDLTRGGYVWDRVNTSSTDVQGKPETDHTHAGDGAGSFAYIRLKGFGYARPVFLESPVFGSTEADCSIRFYQFFPKDYGDLQLYLYSKDTTTYTDIFNGVHLWKSRGAKTWTKVTVSLGSQAAGFRLVFKYSFPSDYKQSEQGSAAIDDISFSSECGMGKPSAVCKFGEFMCQQSKECKPLTARCDLAKDCFHGEDEEDCQRYMMTDFEQNGNKDIFEYDLLEGSLRWKRQQPSSSSDEFAPDRDHTFGNQTGHYMYIERGPAPAAYGVARIKGPVLNGNKEGTCHMRMFYHLNGNYTDAINVYTETSEGGVLKLVWSGNTEEWNAWKRVDIQLDEHERFRVIIEGVRDTDYRGDIGIDDVSFTPQCVKSTHSLPAYFPAPKHGSCKKGYEFPCDGKCLSVDKWCDFKADCADKSDEMSCPSQCDFEDGMCGWTPPGQSKHWKIEEVKFDVDHDPGTSRGSVLKTTVQTGYYLTKAYIESPFFRVSSDNCRFSFWMKNPNRPLKLVIKTKHSDVEEDVLSETISDNGNDWRPVTVTLPACQKDFQLVLAFVSSDYGLNSLIIDDFSFDGCAQDPPTKRCKPGEFQCVNGACIPEDRLCDLTKDCCDNSDEATSVCYEYRRNTFENGIGGWKPKKGSDTWERKEAKPYQDHTFYLTSGHWISASCGRFGPRSIVSVHQMPLPTEMCVVRFWYAFLTQNGNITVIAKPFYGKPVSVASYISPSESETKWIRAEVKIDMHERYELILEGICDEDDTEMFIDDVVFSPGCGFITSKYQQSTTARVTTTEPTTTAPVTTTEPTTTASVATTKPTTTAPATTMKTTTTAPVTTTEPTKTASVATTKPTTTAPVTTTEPTTTASVATTKPTTTAPATTMKTTTAPVTTTKPTTTAPATTMKTTTTAPVTTTKSTTTASVTTRRTTTLASCSNPNQFRCISDGQCILKTQVCDFNIDCADKSDEIGCHTLSTCDFDVDLCGWQETEPDNLDWVRGLSSNVASNHGPRFDASGSSGHYVYIQNTKKGGHLQTQIASLRSIKFSSAASGCALEFYLFHSGGNPGTLSLKINYGHGEEGILWKTEDKSDNWVKVIVAVGRRTSAFSLTFVRSSNPGPFTGEVAIDKIRFSSSCMEPSVVETKCPNEDSMYRCDRGACVLTSQLCDGQDDCGDGSDESRQRCKHYSRESFEAITSPLGHTLTQSSKGELDWSVWNSSVSIPRGLLGVDHSSWSLQGHYMYVTGHPKMKRTDSARLLSKPFKATALGKSCEVRFFVLAPNKGQSVQVGYRTVDKSKSKHSISFRDARINRFGSYWQRVAFTFDHVTRPFVIVIKASPGSPDGALAIDDVTFGPHCRSMDPTLQSSERTGDGDGDGGWITPVAAGVGLLGIVCIVAGVVYYLVRTGKIRGFHNRFQRIVEDRAKSYELSVRHSNTLYHDGMDDPVNVRSQAIRPTSEDLGYPNALYESIESSK